MADLLALAVIGAVLVPAGLGLLALSRRATRGHPIRRSVRLGLIAGPAMAYALWAAGLMRSLLGDPTSHNLWPLEMAFVAAAWLAWIAAVALTLAVLRRMRRTA